MVLVFITYIIFGALMPFAVSLFRKLDPIKVEQPDLELKTVKPLDGDEHDNIHDSPVRQKKKDDHEHDDDDLANANLNYNIDFFHPNFIKE